MLLQCLLIYMCMLIILCIQSSGFLFSILFAINYGILPLFSYIHSMSIFPYCKALCAAFLVLKVLHKKVHENISLSSGRNAFTITKIFMDRSKV